MSVAVSVRGGIKEGVGGLEELGELFVEPLKMMGNGKRRDPAAVVGYSGDYGGVSEDPEGREGVRRGQNEGCDGPHHRFVGAPLYGMFVPSLYTRRRVGKPGAYPQAPSRRLSTAGRDALTVGVGSAVSRITSQRRAGAGCTRCKPV